MKSREEEAYELLKKHDLRVTDCRKEILELFLLSGFALSHPDVEKSLGPQHDRVTIYRTLNSFLEKGLIHKVLDDSGASKYALCQGCGHKAHMDEHIHFKCSICGITNCLDELPFPSFSPSKGYVFQETNILIQGVCPACSNTVSS